MDARQIVLDFAECMNGLMEILRQENAIIATHKYGDLTPLQSRKTQLAKGYAQAQSAVQNDLEVLNALSTEERTDLRKLYKAFRNVLSENMLALRGAHDATDRVVKLIIDAVKQQRGVKTAPLAFGPRSKGYAAYSTPASASIALFTEG
ncbi:MAG: hypothetical protein O3B74_11085 [Proteobacteria bacterium]|nr:hypothetical protein [Pseudomonadota bacterium]MDA1310849.1 hypothetical protein [Pseudomonadota bacterium]